MTIMRGPAVAAVAAVLVGAVASGACAQRSAKADAPAVLTAPSDAARAELVRVVGEALNGAPVTLAADALTRDDTLIVERAERRDTKDMNLGGREMRRPDHFRLVKRGAACILVHVETGRRWTLSSVTCSPR